MPENTPENNPEKNEAKYRHFDKVLKDALRAFLEYEDEHLNKNNDPAVRAARFNAFVMENPEFRVLRNDISPDICEQYLKRYHYVTAPTDEGPEPENAEQRHATAVAVYAEFRSESGFKGSRPAEILAFKDFVNVKYPHTLPHFSEQEAEAAVAGGRRKRNFTLGGYLLGLVVLAGLAGMVTQIPPEPEKPQRKPNTPRIKSNDDVPQWRPLEDDRRWHPPAFNPRDPLPPDLQLPPNPQLQEEWRKQFEKEQKEWLKRFSEDKKGREPGK